jgi:division protein CdvB (Snf7/Vps24/ESCRT-III family)
MNELAEDNIGYYEFLTIIHEISKKSQSIQRDSIKKVYENYDLRLYRKKLDKAIAKLDNLLIKENLYL